MDLSIELKREFAARIIRVVAPVLVISMILTGIGVIVLGGRQYHRLLGAGLAIALIVPSWVLAQKGRSMVGVLFLNASFCLAIVTGVVVSGGVHAPAYTAALVVITIFTILYGVRGGLLFALFILVLGGLSSMLIKYGIMHRVDEPPTAFLYLFHGILLFMQFIFILVPVRLMYRALADSQQQSADLRQAMIGRKQA